MFMDDPRNKDTTSLMAPQGRSRRTDRQIEAPSRKPQSQLSGYCHLRSLLPRSGKPVVPRYAAGESCQVLTVANFSIPIFY